MREGQFCMLMPLVKAPKGRDVNIYIHIYFIFNSNSINGLMK